LHGNYYRAIKGLKALLGTGFLFVQDPRAIASQIRERAPGAPPHFCWSSFAVLFSGAANSFNPTANPMSRLATMSFAGRESANQDCDSFSDGFDRVDMKLALGHGLYDLAALDQMTHVGGRDQHALIAG